MKSLVFCRLDLLSVVDDQPIGILANNGGLSILSAGTIFTLACSYPVGGIEYDMIDLLHRTNPDIIKRLKRAHGHLAGAVTMIEEGRS